MVRVNAPAPGASRVVRVTLRVRPGVDAVKALRGALKVLLRRHGLQCVVIEPVEVNPQPKGDNRE
jgi:hypothetical protein